MLKNHNHDLVKQLSEVSSSLWRMDEYLKNAEGCESCTAMWKQVTTNLNQASDMLVKEINRHSQENRFE
jgi:hypothetical protein